MKFEDHFLTIWGFLFIGAILTCIIGLILFGIAEIFMGESWLWSPWVQYAVIILSVIIVLLLPLFVFRKPKN